MNFTTLMAADLISNVTLVVILVVLAVVFGRD